MKKKLMVYLDNTRIPKQVVTFYAKEGDSLCWEVKGNGDLIIRIERHDKNKWKRETIGYFTAGVWLSWFAPELSDDWNCNVRY